MIKQALLPHSSLFWSFPNRIAFSFTPMAQAPWASSSLHSDTKVFGDIHISLTLVTTLQIQTGLPAPMEIIHFGLINHRSSITRTYVGTFAKAQRLIGHGAAKGR